MHQSKENNDNDIPSKLFNTSSFVLISLFLTTKQERGNIENIFFFPWILFHMTNCVFVSTYCNTNVIVVLIVMNNVIKELLMIASHYTDQITANQNILSIIISNIDFYF